jgi:transposase
MGPKSCIHIELTAEERADLEQRARALRSAYRTVVRARIILALADGGTLSEVGRQVGRGRRVVRHWGRRFMHKRLPGLEDAPRSGRPPAFSPGHPHAPDQACL